MTDSESLQWQPLNALPKVSRNVDEQFTNTREQYEQLLRARDQPHLLDDAIVARVMRLVTDELKFLPVYREQLARWYQSQPTPGQFIDLDRMTRQLDRWRELLEQQLALAQELNVGTIDRVLAKSDHELAAALLAGDMKFPEANDTNAALVAAARVQIATVIDLQMQPLIETRADDLTVLGEMRGTMAGFKQLMDTASPEEMQSLMQRFAGLYRFCRGPRANCRGDPVRGYSGAEVTKVPVSVGRRVESQRHLNGGGRDPAARTASAMPTIRIDT